jgi:hypothetical protein
MVPGRAPPTGHRATRARVPVGTGSARAIGPPTARAPRRSGPPVRAASLRRPARVRGVAANGSGHDRAARSSLVRCDGGMESAQQGLEALHFVPEDRATLCRDPVCPAAVVARPGFDFVDPVVRAHAAQASIEIGGVEQHVVLGSILDRLDDAVPVGRAVREDGENEEVPRGESAHRVISVM